MSGSVVILLAAHNASAKDAEVAVVVAVPLMTSCVSQHAMVGCVISFICSDKVALAQQHVYMTVHQSVSSPPCILCSSSL